MIDVLELVKKTVTSKEVDEIIRENLLEFYGLSPKSEMSLEELKMKYQNEIFCDLDRDLDYFQKNIRDIKQNYQHYEEIYYLLMDEESRKTYASMMAAKVFMNIDYIMAVFSKEEIYFSENIFSFCYEKYIDCGAYDGETTISFLKKHPDTKRALLFEGIDEIAEVCEKNVNAKIDGIQIDIFHKAVCDQEGIVRFSLENGNGDSKLAENGEITVESVSIDSMELDNITFIKMDIEGSEKSAIEGAKATIRKCTPKMAICIYHLEDDFWKIPEMIRSINPNYRFKIRQHDPVSYAETVLYCIPDDMEKPRGAQEEARKNDIDLINYKKDRSWDIRQLRFRENEAVRMKKRIEELEAWNLEQENAKKYMEDQLASKENRIEELEAWNLEQENAKKYMEDQLVHKEKRIAELEAWSKEQDTAKKYFEEQLEIRNKRIDELKNWTEEQDRTKEYLLEQIANKNSTIKELQNCADQHKSVEE